MSRDARPWLPWLAALPVFAVLLGLGTWQVQRLRWKTGVLDRIAAAEAAPPVPLGPAPETYAKVVAAGRFRHESEGLLGLEVRGAVLGGHLITPLLRDDGPPVLVNRGWVPVERAGTVERPRGPVTVTGYVRAPDPPNARAARDDVAGRRFYAFDPPAIGRALGLDAVAPFGLVALAPPAAPAASSSTAPLPDPARRLPRPTNSHLGYAVTWYGLAAALVGVLIAWTRRRAGDPSPPPEAAPRA